MPSNTSFVGCQPIFNRERGVVAYELLFRDSEQNRANVFNPEKASASTLLSAMVDVGLDELIGSARGYINVSEGILFGPHLEGLPRDRITLEILEDVRPTPRVLQRVGELAAMGFEIALDDYVGAPEHAPMLDLADVVKVDVLAMGVDRAVEAVPKLQRPGVRLLAEKVETEEAYEKLRAAGYALFQGYFFCRPKVVKSERLASGRVTTLKLVALLQDPRTDLREVEELVRADVGLSYRLFRYANSAMTRRARPVTSARDAIASLGLSAVRSLVGLLALSGENGKSSGEIMLTCITRARMCELLAESRGVAPGTAFTVGLFSMLDVMMGMPLEGIVHQLGLTGDVRSALIERSGEAGDVLAQVEKYQQAMLQGNDAPAEALSPLYLDALRWSHGTLRSLSAAA